MYTKFIIDELGNRKIIMDWRGNPPFDWNEIEIETLLESHPNYCKGLEFAEYYTGDDWHLQHNVMVTPEYGLLPDFKKPDLPCPRTQLEPNGKHTRELSEDNSLPSRIDAKPVDASFGRPRVRCGLCARSLGFSPPFTVKPIIPEESPQKPPEANRFATYLQILITEGRTSREKMGEAFDHNSRWRDIDRWLGKISRKNNQPYLPSIEKIQVLASVIEEPSLKILIESRASDKENYRLMEKWRNWQQRYRYQEWATIEHRENGAWYQHNHCGRCTHDLSEVVEATMNSGYCDEQKVEFLVESWQRGAAKWKSYAFVREQIGDLSQEELSLLIGEIQSALQWIQTEKFIFASKHQE